MNRRNFLASIVAAVAGSTNKSLYNLLTDVRMNTKVKAIMLSKPGFGHSYPTPRAWWSSPLETAIRWNPPHWATGKSRLFFDELNVVNVPVVTIQDARDILGLPRES